MATQRQVAQLAHALVTLATTIDNEDDPTFVALIDEVVGDPDPNVARSAIAWLAGAAAIGVAHNAILSGLTVPEALAAIGARVATTPAPDGS